MDGQTRRDMLTAAGVAGVAALLARDGDAAGGEPGDVDAYFLDIIGGWVSRFDPRPCRCRSARASCRPCRSSTIPSPRTAARWRP
ncbi:MAG TPA: hypothetical protein VLM79_23375 [Kofleriaceae bacterium]|nr:hypothetical protein [Kofleriaceae bacterium]